MAYLQTNKYNVGQNVNGGVIFRIEHSIYYSAVCAERYKKTINEFVSSCPWSKLDAEWLFKPVYAIEFKEPVSILSREEFAEAYPYVSKEPEQFEKAYHQMVEKRNTLMLPEAAIKPDEVKNEIDNSGKQKIQQLFDFEGKS